MEKQFFYQIVSKFTIKTTGFLFSGETSIYVEIRQNEADTDVYFFGEKLPMIVRKLLLDEIIMITKISNLKSEDVELLFNINKLN